MSEPRRILVCSATALLDDGSIASVGDEALVDALSDALRARYPGADVQRTLRSTSAVAGRVPVRPIGSLLRAIRSADLVIAGGGTLFQEDVRPRPLRPVAGLLRFLVVVALATRAQGRAFAVAGVGAEAMHHDTSRRAARFVLRRATTVSARDSASAELLRGISGREVTVAADTMFLPGVRLPDARPASGAVCVSLRRDAPSSLIAGLAAWLDRSDNRSRPVLLVPMDRRADSDGAALDELAGRLADPGRCRIVAREAPWRQVFQEISAADVCIGMRLHFAIFAALSGRRTIVVGSSPKTRSFAADLGLRSVDLDAGAAPLAAALDAPWAPDAEHMDALRSRGVNALRALEAA